MLVGAVAISSVAYGRQIEDKMSRITRDCDSEETVLLGVSSCFVFYCYEGRKEMFYLKPPQPDNWCVNPSLGEEISCDLDGDEIPSGTILGRNEVGPKCGLEVCVNSDIVFYEKTCDHHREYKDAMKRAKKRMAHTQH